MHIRIILIVAHCSIFMYMCLSLYRDQDEEDDHIDNIAGVNLKVSIIYTITVIH